MNPALWQLVARGVRGRVLRWLRLLRRPRYLIGTLVAAGWMLFWVGRPALRFMGRGGNTRGFDPDLFSSLLGGEVAGLVELAAALAVALLVGLWWLIPLGQTGIKFSEAEIALLLPAPLSRRAVIQYAALKNQPGILIGSTLVTVFAPISAPSRRAGLFLVVWILFTLWDFHSMGRGLWLARLRELPSAQATRLRMIQATLAAAFLGVLVLELGRLQPILAEALGALAGTRSGEWAGAIEPYAARIQEAGILPWVLWPFRLLVRPLLMTTVTDRVAALPFALLVGAVHHEWVVRSKVRFEESVLRQATTERKRAAPGSRFGRLSTPVRLRAPFRLAHTGWPEIAIVWKNLIQIRRLSVAKTLGWVAAGVAAAAVLPALLGAGEIVFYLMALGGGMFTLLLPLFAGAQFRNDLRGDLPHAEILRTWPVEGWRLFLAEITAPVFETTLRSFMGVGLVLAATLGLRLRALFGGNSGELVLLPEGWGAQVGTTDAVAVVFLVAGLLPLVAAVSAISAALRNLAVLLFPGWMQLGATRPRSAGPAGFGQHMLVASVLFLVVAIGLLPGALAVGGVLLAHALTETPFWFWELPFLGLLGAAPLLLEIGLCVLIGGSLWDRLDPSGEILSDA